MNKIKTDRLGVRHVYDDGGPAVLLIKPPFNFLPIGLAHVAQALRENGIGYDIVDLSIVPTPKWDTILTSRRYTAVASGGLFGDYATFCTLFTDLHKAHPHIPRILGGPITWDVDCDLLLNHIPADVLVIGEGEVTAPELVHRLASGSRDFCDIPGLVWRDGGTKASPPRGQIDLNAKNYLPDWDIVDFQFYNIRWTSVLTGRGCTGRCSFCSPTNGRFRARPLDHIMSQLERDASLYNVEAFGFHTEILFPDAAATKAFCERYKASGLNKPFSCLLRVDFPTEAIGQLREAGCTTIHIGVESGSDRILSLMKKRTTVDMIRSFVVQARQHKGLTIRSSIMFGNYGETESDLSSTFDLACELKLRQNTAFVINYPGTLNYRRAQKTGLIGDEHAYLLHCGRWVMELPWGVMTKVNNGEAPYANISDVPTTEMLKAVEKGLRRFYATTYRAAVIGANVLPDGTVEVRSRCPFCGDQYCTAYDTTIQSPLELVWHCSCRNDDPRPLYVSGFDVPIYDTHLTMCQRQLASASKIAVLQSGNINDAEMLVWADRTGFDIDKICAFTATPSLPAGWAINYRVLPLSEVRALAPDAFVVPYRFPSGLPGYGCSPLDIARFERDTPVPIVRLIPHQQENSR